MQHTGAYLQAVVPHSHQINIPANCDFDKAMHEKGKQWLQIIELQARHSYS